MNRVTQNVDLKFKPFFFQFQKQSLGPFEVFHAHKGMEFIFVHDGAGRVILEQEKAEVQPGTLICYMPFQLHKLVMEPRVPFVRSILIFEPSVLSPYLRIFPQLRSLFMQFVENPSFPHIIGPMADQRQLNELLGGFQAQIHESQPEHQLEVFAAFMIAFLRQLPPLLPCKWVPPVSKATSGPTHHVSKIMHWIEQHYMDDFSLEQLGKELHLSSCYVSHLFREATGESISAYLANRRVREVCLLLKTSSLPLQDIGRRVGLPNIPYLCTVFKKVMNVTPNQYRKMFNLHMTREPDSE
ncbi:AraC family transcriptional regulator [Paenibacillus cremeus]|nr:AraC family transcriptional regulator [Paenibacillus cremeus]